MQFIAVSSAHRTCRFTTALQLVNVQIVTPSVSPRAWFCAPCQSRAERNCSMGVRAPSTDALLSERSSSAFDGCSWRLTRSENPHPVGCLTPARAIVPQGAANPPSIARPVRWLPSFRNRQPDRGNSRKALAWRVFTVGLIRQRISPQDRGVPIEIVCCLACASSAAAPLPVSTARRPCTESVDSSAFASLAPTSGPKSDCWFSVRA